MQSRIAHFSIARLTGFGAGVIAVAALGFTACSSSKSAAPAITDSARVVDTLTGFVFKNGGQPAGFVLGEPTLGDDDASDPGQTARGFVTFDIGAIPATAHVRTATLAMRQCEVVGVPYTNHGNVILDHVVFPAADTTIYGQAAIATNVAMLSSDSTVGAKQAVVTTSVASDLGASRTTSQFRVRWSTTDSNQDSVSDFVAFDTDSLASAACAWTPGVSPTLTVQYTK